MPPSLNRVLGYPTDGRGLRYANSAGTDAAKCLVSLIACLSVSRAVMISPIIIAELSLRH